MSSLKSHIGDLLAKNTYRIRCHRNGKLIWEEKINNLVVDEGLNDVLSQYFKGSSYTAAHYMGLKGAGAIAAANTLASHAAWAEITAYSGDRKAITLGAVASQSVDNTASPCQFTFTGSAAVDGIFVATVATGTSGVLFGAADFAATRNVIANDVLSIDATFTQASA